MVITQEQYDRFKQKEAIGSHVEIISMDIVKTLSELG